MAAMEGISMATLTTKIDSLTERVTSVFSFRDFMLLWLRLWIGKIFYDSGRTKAEGGIGEGYLQINDFQGTLFEEEYGIDFVDPEFMAQMALYGETFLPLMLFAGLGARVGALGLLGMTIFIQVFVYPAHFYEHATWAAALLVVMIFGAGRISLDQIFRKKIN